MKDRGSRAARPPPLEVAEEAEEGQLCGGGNDPPVLRGHMGSRLV